MKRENITQASELESRLQTLERERWVIANLISMTFQVKKAKDAGPDDDGRDDGNIPPEWWTLNMEVDLSVENMLPVRNALLQVYDDEIDRTKKQLRQLGVDTEDVQL